MEEPLVPPQEVLTCLIRVLMPWMDFAMIGPVLNWSGDYDYCDPGTDCTDCGGSSTEEAQQVVVPVEVV